MADIEGNTYDKLSIAFLYSKVREIIWEVIEVFLGLFTGGLIADAFAEKGNLSMWVVIGIPVCVIILIPLTFSRLLKSAYFPDTVVKYLKVTEDLRKLKKELDRKKNIDVYIDEAIQSLNVNTCSFQGQEESIDNALCENPLDDGIKTVLNSIIDFPQYILDCSKAKFTIAAYLHFYPEKVQVPDQPNKYTINYVSKTLKLRDDFRIEGILTDDILEDIYAEGLKFHVHTVALNAYNHVELKQKSIHDNNLRLKLFAAPIPAVCEGGKIGVLLIFAEEDVCMPKDLENTLLIFGRILANWISKYEDCVNRRRENVSATIVAK